MSAQHAKGSASLDMERIGLDLANHIPIDIGTHSAAALVVWNMEGCERTPRCEANARRLVACWNACEGIDTDHLEKHGLPDFAEKISDLSSQLETVTQQRAVLLEALTRVLALPVHPDAIRLAHRRAEDAIAKVKGGAA